MSNDYIISELIKRVENIIRIGTIEQVDTKTAKARIKSGDLITDWLPWLSRRAGKNIEWWSPGKGEQVLILSVGGDLSQGVILPSLYQNAHPPPSNDENVYSQKFGNGDYINHNQKTGILTINAQKIRIIGSVEQTGGDMTSDGISAQHHRHGGVLSGPSKTGEPE